MDFSIYIPNSQYRYYYEQFDRRKQIAYVDLLDGYLNQLSSIFIKVDSMDEVWDIHRAVCYDVPEVFYIKNVRATFNPIFRTAIVYPEYRFDEKTRNNILLQMEQASQMFVERIGMLSESEKVKQIHDYLVRSVTYKDLDAPYSHEAPGALLYGIGVCEGISKAFKYLSDRVHVASLVVIGNSGNEANISSASGHAWNIVYVEGCPYHLDVTFDYSVSKDRVVRYDYYLLSDSQIQVDHTYTNLPACNDSTEYYINVGCFADSKRELQKLVTRELGVGSPLVFKMPFLSGDKNEIVDVILNLVVEALPLTYAVGHNISISYNLPRMIFQVQLI